MGLITRTVEESQRATSARHAPPDCFPCSQEPSTALMDYSAEQSNCLRSLGTRRPKTRRPPLRECTADCSREHPDCSIEHFKFMCWKTLTYQPNHPTPYLNLSQDNTNPPLVHQASSPFWITRFLPLYHSNPSSFKNYISQFHILYSSLAGMV